MTMQQPPPQPDLLYQSYDKGLYRITGDEGFDSILDIMAADSSGVSTNAQQVETSVSNLGSGTAVVTTNQASGQLSSGQTLFNDGQPGYFLGVQDGVAVLSIGEATSSYLTWDGSTLTISGTISASTIIGGTFETSASAPNIVLSGADNKLYFNDATQRVVTIGTASLYAITIDPSTDTNNGINIVSTVAGNAIAITNNAAVLSRALFISQTSSSNSLNSIDVTYGGTANGISVITNASPSAGIFVDVNSSSGGNGLVVQSISSVNAAVFVLNPVGEAMFVEGGGTSSTLAISGGSPSGNTGVFRIAATNDGDGISLTQAASNASNFAIGMHINLTNSAANSKAAAFRIEGDSVVASAVSGSQSTKIRVLIGATVFYIPAYTA